MQQLRHYHSSSPHPRALLPPGPLRRAGFGWGDAGQEETAVEQVGAGLVDAGGVFRELRSALLHSVPETPER